MLTLQHVTLRYVRVENRHKNAGGKNHVVKMLVTVSSAHINIHVLGPKTHHALLLNHRDSQDG